jgi:hypothetical protein
MCNYQHWTILNKGIVFPPSFCKVYLVPPVVPFFPYRLDFISPSTHYTAHYYHGIIL